MYSSIIAMMGKTYGTLKLSIITREGNAIDVKH